MPFQDWLYLFFICWLGAMSPGPSLLVVLSVVSDHGRNSAILVSVGHGIGVFMYALGGSLGLAYLIKNFPQIFYIIQALGACFLLWIAGWLIYNNLKSIGPNKKSKIRRSKNTDFFTGFFVAILNPKIAVFFISVFSQFLVPTQSSSTHLLMAVLAGTVDTFVYCLFVCIAVTKWINIFLETYKRQIGLAFGILLAFLGISLFYSPGF